MWVDRRQYEALCVATAQAVAEARTLAEQNKALLVTQDWFRVRLTQLEQERAQLIWNYMGVKVPTPVVERESPVRDPDRHPLHETLSFNDVGDETAAKLGISWNPDGTLNYNLSSQA